MTTLETKRYKDSKYKDGKTYLNLNVNSLYASIWDNITKTREDIHPDKFTVETIEMNFFHGIDVLTEIDFHYGFPYLPENNELRLPEFPNGIEFVKGE
jgi:hypothetical protein